MTISWPGRHRKLLLWTAGSVAALLVATAGTGYALLRHFNGNLTQVNLTSLVGPQTANQPGTNVLFIGTDGVGPDDVQPAGDTWPNQADTITLMHLTADGKSGLLMAVPRISWVHIPSCRTSDGTMSVPQDDTLGEAFAIGNKDGKHQGLGSACVVKALEQNTGIQVDHFITADFTGITAVVNALGGVHACLQDPVTDPNSGLTVPAGCRTLNAKQVLAFVRARANNGTGYQAQRVARGQSLVASLMDGTRSRLQNPATALKFLNAVTKAITVDTQVGGVTGLARLAQTASAVPSSQLTQFTLAVTPRATTATDGQSTVAWTSADRKVFAAIKADQPVDGLLQG